MVKSELEIIKNCQQGKLDDFGALYEQYIRKIYDFIYYKTYHKEIAEDLSSQTFIKALESINSFDGSKGSFGSWIYRIAQNTVIDYYRTRKFDKNIEDVWDLGDEADQDSDLDNKQKLAELRKYLKNFKPIQRNIVILRIWQQLSYKEIAEITNLSEANCKMIYSRVLKQLKLEMPLELFILFISLKYFI